MTKSNGFLQLRRGVWEHVRDGRMSVTEALAFIYICCEADTRNGIWKGSAKSLSGELGIPERTARDVLERMEHGDYIRRFALPGRHSCYPILVHKFLITDGEHNGEQLNALESKSPVHLAYFPREQSVQQNGEHGVEYGAAQKRKRIEKETEKRAAAKTAPPADARFYPFVKFAYDAFQAKIGQKPSWQGKDRKSLQLLFAGNKSLGLEELKTRWTNFLASTETFTAKEGYSLACFCTHVGSFIAGPILARKGEAAMESQLLPISQSETREHSDSTDSLIKAWLFRFGIEHKEDVAPRLPLWLEQLGGIEPGTLTRLFERAMRTCKFFPNIAEILEPLQAAEKTAAPVAAEEAWEGVLDLRRRYWNPDMPGGFHRGMPKLPERIAQAARAAGVFRDFESVEALHVWAKKRFVESFIAYGELKRDGFLLPDGEIKNLLTEMSQAKALPRPSRDWNGLRQRGLAYAQKLKDSGLQQPDIKRAIRAVAGELTPRPPMRSLDEQKRILRERALLP